MDKNTIKDRIRGSLRGGAIGDALGYPVEFIYSYADIQKRYGDNGITRLDTKQWWLDSDSGNGKAVISDDTQMTLFTVCGLLNAKAQGKAPIPAISDAYIEWLFTQIGWESKLYSNCWIGKIPELNQRRAPGHTCISALKNVLAGKKSYNDSKGCGGVMRTAPVALYGAVWRDNAEGEVPVGRISNIQDVDRLAADAAEITHHHPLGWLPSALEAHIIYRLVQADAPTVEDFKAYIAEGYETLNMLYPEQQENIGYLRSLTDMALDLAGTTTSDVENMEKIGGGWVGEEAFAMATYCTAKYFDNFEMAMIAAVNHAGDSDSTGAVTGNILGAAIGYAAIPQHFKDDVELHDVILHVADDLWRGKTTRFNYEDPMPKKMEVAKPLGNPLDVYVSVPQDFYLTSKQMDIIRYGHIPDVMEDHWYMYCDDNAIHYLRSWTGLHIFEAHYEKSGDDYRITELRINNNPNEYRLSDAESATALFYALLISEYGGDASAYWKAAL